MNPSAPAGVDSVPQPAFIDAGATPPLRQNDATDTPAAQPSAPMPRLHAPSLRGESAMRWTAIAAGVTASAALCVAVGLLTPAGSVLQRMFDLQRPETLIPALALALFFYALVLLQQRAWAVGELRRVARIETARQLATAIAQHGVAKVLEAAERPELRGNPLARRTAAVLRQWLLQPGRAEAELALQAEADADRDAMQRLYGWIGAIVWTLPVIGLMAAVLGISASVEGFARFLSGDIDNIRTVKSALVGVTGGLGFAFLLTLLGLVTAVVVMFHSAAVQRREEKLQAALGEWMMDLILPAVQRAQPARQAASEGATTGPLVEIFGKALRATAAHMIDTFRTALREERRDERLAATEIAERAAASLAGAGQAVAHSMAAAGGEAVAKLDGVAQLVAEMQRLHDADARAQAEQRQAQAVQMQAHVQAQAAGIEAAVQAAKLVAGSVQQLNEAVRTTVAALHDANLVPALRAVGERLNAQTSETHSNGERLAALVQSTRELATCHAEVQRGVLGIETLGLHRTLGDLGRTLARVQPVLEQFQRPFVFAAVPAASVGERGAS